MHENLKLQSRDGRYSEGLVANFAWQIVAQLARQFSDEFEFSLRQVHPGSSLGGYLSLEMQKKSELGKGQRRCINFFMGGGNLLGSMALGIPKDEEHGFYKIDNLVPFFGAFIYSKVPALYERVVQDLRLPRWKKALGRANRFAISAQFISSVQNAICMNLRSYRPVFGDDKPGADNCTEQSPGIGHHTWVYQYYGSAFPTKMEEMVTQGEAASLIAVLPFDSFEDAKPKFVVDSRAASVRVLTEGRFTQQIELADLYRKDKGKFFGLATELAYFQMLDSSQEKFSNGN